MGNGRLIFEALTANPSIVTGRPLFAATNTGSLLDLSGKLVTLEVILTYMNQSVGSKIERLTRFDQLF